MDKPGWKQLCCYVKNNKKMNQLIKDAKDNHHINIVKIKFWMKIPRDHKQAMLFDADNGNINWEGFDILEIKQIYKFDPFNSLGPVNSACIPSGHTKI